MDKNFYSATMLTGFINYKHYITDEFSENILKLKKSKKTVAENLRIEKGILHEEEYFKKLSKKYKKVKNIKKLKNLTKNEKIKETIDALKNGYELIYGGWLSSGNWIGELDFLEINKSVGSDLGNWSYEIIDTKNTPKVKKDHIYQVSLYSFLLKEVQGAFSENFYILLKDNSKETIKLKEVYDIFLKHKNLFEKFIQNNSNKIKLEKIFNYIAGEIESSESINELIASIEDANVLIDRLSDEYSYGDSRKKYHYWIDGFSNEFTDLSENFVDTVTSEKEPGEASEIEVKKEEIQSMHVGIYDLIESLDDILIILRDPVFKNIYVRDIEELVSDMKTVTVRYIGDVAPNGFILPDELVVSSDY